MKMNKKFKPIPVFKTENEEFEFWSTHDFTEYGDWSKAIRNPKFPNLKFTDWNTKESVISFPNQLVEKVKQKAKRANVPYEDLAAQYIEQGLASH